jgi:hypothetical protein
MLARNRCSNCGHAWQDRPMGFAIHPVCPRCTSAYWEWTNYDPSPPARRHTPSVSLATDPPDDP